MFKHCSIVEYSTVSLYRFKIFIKVICFVVNLVGGIVYICVFCCVCVTSVCFVNRCIRKVSIIFKA